MRNVHKTQSGRWTGIRYNDWYAEDFVHGGIDRWIDQVFYIKYLVDCVRQIFARNELYFPGGTYAFERMELDGSQCNVWIFIEEILLF